MSMEENVSPKNRPEDWESAEQLAKENPFLANDPRTIYVLKNRITPDGRPIEDITDYIKSRRDVLEKEQQEKIAASGKEKKERKEEDIMVKHSEDPEKEEK